MDRHFELRPRRMNVIWVFGDAVGDRVPAQRPRLDSAVAGAPWCSPFRALLRDLHHAALVLYDTAGDPYEQTNLVYWYDHQEAKQRCHRRLARWIAETGDTFELPDIDLEGAAGL